MSSFWAHLSLSSASLCAAALAAAALLLLWRQRPVASYRLLVVLLCGALALPLVQLGVEGWEAPRALAERLARAASDAAHDTHGGEPRTALVDEPPLFDVDQLEDAEVLALLELLEGGTETAPLEDESTAPMGGLAATWHAWRPGWGGLLASLASLYAVGVLVSLLRSARRLLRTKRLFAAAWPVEDAGVRAVWEELLEECPAARDVELKASDRVDVPVCFGLRRRAILLPASGQPALEPEVLRCVLLHELVHLERRDSWVMLLQEALHVLFWFHPAAWWISCKVDTLRELSCDLLVVRRTGLCKRYAAALVEYAAWMGRDSRRGPLDAPTALLTWTGSKSQLTRRIEMLIARKQTSVLSRWTTTLVACALFGFLWTGQLVFAAALAPSQEPATVPEVEPLPPLLPQEPVEPLAVQEPPREHVATWPEPALAPTPPSEPVPAARPVLARPQAVASPASSPSPATAPAPAATPASIPEPASMPLLAPRVAAAPVLAPAPPRARTAVVVPRVAAPSVVPEPRRPRTVAGIGQDGPVIGVSLEPVPDLAEVLGRDPESLFRIVEVYPGFPSDRAGLREGDVLVSFDGSPADWTTIGRAKVRLADGQPVSVGLIRDGRPLMVTLATTGSSAERGRRRAAQDSQDSRSRRQADRRDDQRERAVRQADRQVERVQYKELRSEERAEAGARRQYEKAREQAEKMRHQEVEVKTREEVVQRQYTEAKRRAEEAQRHASGVRVRSRSSAGQPGREERDRARAALKEALERDPGNPELLRALEMFERDGRSRAGGVRGESPGRGRSSGDDVSRELDEALRGLERGAGGLERGSRSLERSRRDAEGRPRDQRSRGRSGDGSREADVELEIRRIQDMLEERRLELEKLRKEIERLRAKRDSTSSLPTSLEGDAPRRLAGTR